MWIIFACYSGNGSKSSVGGAELPTQLLILFFSYSFLLRVREQVSVSETLRVHQSHLIRPSLCAVHRLELSFGKDACRWTL